MFSMLKSRVSLATNLIAALGWLAFVAYMLIRSDILWWDFHVYRSASSIFISSGDPYIDLGSVQVIRVKAALPYVYPPLTLLAFAPFTVLPAKAAATLWLALKFVAGGFLWKSWSRRLGTPIDGRFALFALVGFNASLLTDLLCGNAAFFECCLLTYAMFALIDKRTTLFVVLVCAAAAFKVTPLFLLVLAPVMVGRAAIRPCVYAVFGFILYFAANLALFPKITMEFVATAASRDESRANNPSLLEFSRDLATRIPLLDFHLVYASCSIAILWVGYRALKAKVWDATETVFFGWTTLALVLPRLMVYSFVPFLPIAWLVAMRLKGWPRILLLVAICFQLPESYLFTPRPGLGPIVGTALAMKPELYGYLSLYVLFAVWVLMIQQSRSKDLHETVPVVGESFVLP
jgi:hypothetical protein